VEAIDRALVLARHILEGEQQLALALASRSGNADRIRNDVQQVKAALEETLQTMSSADRAVYNERLARVRLVVLNK